MNLTPQAPIPQNLPTDPRLSMLAPIPAEITAATSPAVAQSYDRAMELLASNNPSDAYPLFVSVVTADPTHAAAWYQIGLLLFADRRFPAAYAALEKVNQLYPDNPRILTNLGWYAHASDDLDAALHYLTRATQIGPNLFLAWSNLSQIHVARSDLDSALLCARRGVDLCFDGNPNPSMSLAFTHLFRGELLDGLRFYEARFRYKLQQFLAYAYPMWKGEKVNTLFLRAEQGIGDTISTLRFLPEAARRCDRLLCYVNAELRTFVEAMNLPHTEVHALPAVLPAQADAWLPMMSLPSALNLEMSDLPAFELPFGFPSPSNTRISPANTPLRIGLVWSGSDEMDMARWRNMQLRDLIPLLSAPNTQWFALQKGNAQREISGEGVHGIINDLSPQLIDMRETASVIANLDLVVSVCTSVAHLSAAMNRPTIVIRNRRSSDWRWGLGSGTPSRWYGPHVQIFEKDYSETWATVVAKVKGYINDKTIAS